MRTALVLGIVMAGIAVGAVSVLSGAHARSRIAERLAQRRSAPVADAALPAHVRVWHDQAYGANPRQRYDVYAPRDARQAPTLFLVHGGGWRFGDKRADNVVSAKVAHWTAQGYVVISTNYRLLPDADPLTQARDVATAVASAQRDSARWGGDPERFVLMGHSAGAHLSALLAAAPTWLMQAHARPVRGAVLLDSAVLDTERFMGQPHPQLYDAAFGDDPAYWRAASPSMQLTAPGVPLLAVCSARRAASCAQAHAFAAQANRLGRRTQVLEQDLSHGEVNAELGKPSAYTAAVDRYLRGL